MTTIDGVSQRPTRTRASTPVRLPDRAKCDDDRASLSRFVSGDLATTANLAEVVSGVPTSGLKAKTSGACGSSGSIPAGASRWRSQVPRPTPPMNRRKTSSGSGTDSAGRWPRRSGGSGRGSRTRSAPSVGAQDENPAAGRHGLGPVVNEALAVDRHQVKPRQLAGVGQQAPRASGTGRSPHCSRSRMVLPRTRTSDRPARKRAMPRNSTVTGAAATDTIPLPSPYAPEPVVNKGAILLVDRRRRRGARHLLPPVPPPRGGFSGRRGRPGAARLPPRPARPAPGLGHHGRVARVQAGRRRRVPATSR